MKKSICRSHSLSTSLISTPSIFFVTVQIHILSISDQNPEPGYYYWDDSVPAILTNGFRLIIKYYLMYQ